MVNREQDTEKSVGVLVDGSLSHALSVGQSHYRYKNPTRSQIIFTSFFYFVFNFSLVLIR